MKTIPLIQADIPEAVKSRLLNKIEIDSSSCWIWRGAKNSKGYGKIGIRGRTVSAYRVSYAIFNGDVLEGLYVCHRCDVPACVNPEHLFLGTAQENTVDSFDKERDNKKGKKLSPERREQVCSNLIMGRPTDEARAKISAYHKGKIVGKETKKKMSESKLKIRDKYLGSNNPATKLKEVDITEIRRRHKDGATIASIARSYKVGESTVRRIVKRRLWTHI